MQLDKEENERKLKLEKELEESRKRLEEEELKRMK